MRVWGEGVEVRWRVWGERVEVWGAGMLDGGEESETVRVCRRVWCTGERVELQWSMEVRTCAGFGNISGK